MIVQFLIYLIPLFIVSINGQVLGSIRGVSLGSLYVLEPFIAPHLFYQFLGNKERVVSDTYSLCEYLGPYRTNKLLKEHWNEWINENIIDTIYKSGLNTIRIPVGDYMYKPYGPYLIEENGVKCFDGSIEHLDKILNYMNKYKFKIIIDVHAWKDSQNGFDNSGQTKNIVTKLINDTLYYEHWNIRSAQWTGNYDIINQEYTDINYSNIDNSLDVINIILNKYKNYENIWGLCPMNEPWENTPEYILKYFYKSVYNNFITTWSYDRVLIFHDSFRPYLWDSCDFINIDKNNIKINIYLDTHQYKAWNNPVPFDILIDSIKNWNYPKTCFPILIGEFSLATDNCQMWLNGFMDNIPNYPLQPCLYDRCPRINEGNNRIYIRKSVQGPFGTGISYPTEYGMCPITTPIGLNKKIAISNTNSNINANLNFTEDYYAITLYNELTNIFENKTSGWIFWNFRTSSKSYSWNYLSSYNLGYVNKYSIENKQSKYIINIKDYLINTSNNKLKYIFTYILLFIGCIVLIITLFYYFMKLYRQKKKVSFKVEYRPLFIKKNYYNTFMSDEDNINITNAIDDINV